MNEITRCKNCASWRPEDAEEVSGFGKCVSSHFHLTYTARPTTPVTDVVVEHDEGWGFETGPEFGCVHWEQK